MISKCAFQVVERRLLVSGARLDDGLLLLLPNANYFNGVKLLGGLSRNCSGLGGARLFAVQSDVPITSVPLSVDSAAGGYAVAQFRYALVTPGRETPEPRACKGVSKLANWRIFYSYRSAVTGSTRVARRAGMYPAATAIIPRTAADAP